MVLPVAGIQGVVAVVAHHEVAVFRNFKMVSFMLVHRFCQIRLVERSVGTVQIDLIVDDIDDITRHTDHTLYIVDRMTTFSDFGTAGRAGILLVAFDDGVAFRALPAKDEDRDISAFRICEFVVQPGADDAASCHDGVFHGTGRDLTVCDDKSRENEGNDGGGYKNLDPADQLRYPACFFFLFFSVIFHIKMITSFD